MSTYQKFSAGKNCPCTYNANTGWQVSSDHTSSERRSEPEISERGSSGFGSFVLESPVAEPSSLADSGIAERHHCLAICILQVYRFLFRLLSSVAVAFYFLVSGQQIWETSRKVSLSGKRTARVGHWVNVGSYGWVVLLSAGICRLAWLRKGCAGS